MSTTPNPYPADGMLFTVTARGALPKRSTTTGPTDMVAAMRSLRDAGFDGPIRPDHVPQLVGEEDDGPGYTMLGRLFAYGYIRGLIQATAAGSPTAGRA